MDEDPLGQWFLAGANEELRACSAQLRARSAALDCHSVELKRVSAALRGRSVVLVALVREQGKA
jgi:hypothetical protein